ncbi:MAG: hypothetical protein ACYS9X_27570 [Planctomycetota bacterium]|jgi:hypothetical protein
MAHGNDSIVARLALERDYVSEVQLEDARVSQRQARDVAGLDLSLLQVLANKHFITPGQEDDLKTAVAVETGEARQVGGYEVTEKIGQGGFGAVFKACCPPG